MTAVARSRSPWLFSPGVDVAVFGGSALLALVALGLGAQLGVLSGDTPEWAWVPAVLLVDVAHVWSTGFRIYLDPAAFRRRPILYVGTPLACFVAGVVLYGFGSAVFWRALAYLAVFHFIRQQYGWVQLYRAKGGEHSGAWLDGAAVYLATLYPLLWWHAHLPRHFWWFMAGDFAALPAGVLAVATPIYYAVMFAYIVRALHDGIRHGQWHAGKHLIVGTTALLWYIGIVGFDSDYAFTITNVLPHGIPYMVLIWWYGRGRRRQGQGFRLFDHSPLYYLGIIWLLAYGEELLWDRSIWQERSWLFGDAWDVDALQAWLVPLLALPQLTHYVLDGFIWRRRSNPELDSL